MRKAVFFSFIVFASCQSPVSVPPISAPDEGTILLGVRDGAVQYSSQGYTLTVKNQDPGLDNAIIRNLVDCFFRTYPGMSARFNTRSYKNVSLEIIIYYAGTAFVGDSSIYISAQWLRSHPNDVDVVTHEAFHLVQAYPCFNDYYRYRLVSCVINSFTM